MIVASTELAVLSVGRPRFRGCYASAACPVGGIIFSLSSVLCMHMCQDRGILS